MKKNTESIGKEKMTDQELSDAFGRYQRQESIGILLGALLVIAGCISAFVRHDVLLVCIPAFAGVGLILLLALPAQKKKKALMEQQLGGFFRTELTRAFGPEPQTPELPIDYAYLKKVQLLACPWEQSTITEFHEGGAQGDAFFRRQRRAAAHGGGKIRPRQRQLDDSHGNCFPGHYRPL